MSDNEAPSMGLELGGIRYERSIAFREEVNADCRNMVLRCFSGGVNGIVVEIEGSPCGGAPASMSRFYLDPRDVQIFTKWLNSSADSIGRERLGARKAVLR